MFLKYWDLDNLNLKQSATAVTLQTFCLQYPTTIVKWFFKAPSYKMIELWKLLHNFTSKGLVAYKLVAYKKVRNSNQKE